MPGAHQRELELKFELTCERLRQLDQHPALSEMAVGQPNTRTLRSIYFDTPAQRLRGAGISLRVRSDGNIWVQTIKCGFYVGDGVSNPFELEATVDGPEPQLGAISSGKLRRKLARLIDGSCLEPVFETVIKRIARRLHSADADLELALDEGVIRAGTSERALCEAELELKAGPPAALLEAATRLFADAPIHLANQNKAEQGYDLAMGRSSIAPRPAHSKPMPLDASATCRQAFVAVVASTASQIRDNRRVVLETHDPEGAHQLRVGLRRLRSALRAFRPLIDNSALQDMDKHAQSLARIVGELRDAEVLIDDIYVPVAGPAGEHSGLRALKDALLRHRAAKRVAARAALEGTHWSHLLLHVVLFPQSIAACAPLDAPVEGFSCKAIDQIWKKTARKSKRIHSLSGEERHKMRKRLKQLRYTVEFFAPLYPARAVKPFVKRLKRLQNVFGYVNDVVTARQVEDIASAHCHDDGHAQTAAGYILGWHSSRASLRWEEAQDDWHELKKAARFWR